MIAGEKIHPLDTLVIFDEVQECPEALNALKYFKEKANEYHVIAAGSLLGKLADILEIEASLLYDDFSRFLACALYRSTKEC